MSGNSFQGTTRCIQDFNVLKRGKERVEIAKTTR